MFGAVAKTYWAQKIGKEAKDLYVVSVMPCHAKKSEAERPEMNSSGVQDVDAVLTTRELARMIKEAGLDFATLPDETVDRIMGVSTGAADIFANSGGVMEAALRTAYEKVTGAPCPSLDFKSVRGVEGVKEATIDLKGTKINVAVSNGLNNAKLLFDRLLSKTKTYHLIEVMACPGGCVGGGGQPYPPEGMYVLDPNLIKTRAKALYAIDAQKTLRRSHESPVIQELYREFLGEPNGHKSHELLHTSYAAREPRGVK